MFSVGKYTYGTEGIKVFHFGNKNLGKITIGSYCSIGSGATMFLNENHKYEWVTTYPFGHLHNNIFDNYNKDQDFLFSMSRGNGDIIIGNDVWLGLNVTIMSGVTIGDGAVIAANSHIVKNVEPYSIIGGNPAKHIKYRFNKKQIDDLLKIKWWNFNEYIINENLNLMMKNNIDEFIYKFNKNTKKIVFIIRSFTFNNPNTSVSDDFLKSIKNTNYETTIFYDNDDAEIVKEYIEINKPSLIIIFDVCGIDTSITNKFNFIFKMNIPKYLFMEDTYYLSSINEYMNKMNGLIFWYKNSNANKSYNSLYPKVSIKNCFSRFVNTNIYKDYGLDKKYDILLYGSRNVYSNYKQQKNISIQNHIAKIEELTNSTVNEDEKIIFYPLRSRLVSIMEKLKSKYNILIIPEISILDQNILKYSNDTLSMLINQSYMTVACPGIADVLMHKHLEIPASKSVILGKYPSDYADLFEGNMVNVDEFMSEEQIINIIDEALANKPRLLEMSERLYEKIHTEHNLKKASENFEQIIDEILD